MEEILKWLLKIFWSSVTCLFLSFEDSPGKPPRKKAEEKGPKQYQSPGCLRPPEQKTDLHYLGILSNKNSEEQHGNQNGNPFRCHLQVPPVDQCAQGFRTVLLFPDFYDPQEIRVSANTDRHACGYNQTVSLAGQALIHRP